MLKAFGKLWLKGARRLAKSQVAQQKKLQKKLVNAVLAAPKKRPGKVKPAGGKPVAQTARPAAGKLPTGSAEAAAARTGPGRKRQTTTTKPRASAGSIDEGGIWSNAYFSLPVSVRSTSRSHARRLSYSLFVPTPDSAAPVVPEPLPLVVMLHGCEQTARDFASGTRMNRLAVRHGFAVLYPQQSVSAHAQRCWPWYKRSVQQGHDEITLIAGAIEKEIARRGFDRSRVYVAGLSAGAAMAQILAIRHPALIAAVGSHSGPVYGLADSRMSAFSVMQHGGREVLRPVAALLAAQPDFPAVPIMILQGQQDSVVRPVNGSGLAHQFCRLNRLPQSATVAPVVHPAGAKSDAYRITDHGPARRPLVRLCEITHLGHAWSGGDPALRYNAANGPDASALLWRFFKLHRRR